MPLKLTSNTRNGELKLSWNADDDSMEASWRIGADDDEETILSKLEKVIRFVRIQRGEHAAAIKEVEDFLVADALPTGERIAVPPPQRSGNDLPAGGPPVLGWATMAARPEIPAHAVAAGWEYIPPGE